MSDMPTEERAASLRMDAYYYGFDETGVREVDLILSAVACAGKAFHHTSSWTADAYGGVPPAGHEGLTPLEWITNATTKAAATIREQGEEIERLTKERDEALSEVERLRESLCKLVKDADGELTASRSEAERLAGRVKELEDVLGPCIDRLVGWVREYESEPGPKWQALIVGCQKTLAAARRALAKGEG